MAKHCAICGKKSEFVWKLRKLRGKYNRTNKKKKHPNLQWVILKNGKRVKACAKCIKSFGKSKRQRTKAVSPAPQVKPQAPEVKPEIKKEPAKAKKEKPAKAKK